MTERGMPPAYGVGWLPDGLYILTNSMSRTVLDLKGGSSSEGTRCYGYSRNTNDYIDHQLWTIKRDPSRNTYTLQNLRGTTYLDLQGGRREDGSQVTGCSRSRNDQSRRHQEWRIKQVPDGHMPAMAADPETNWGTQRLLYTIQCVGTNTYLEVAGGNPNNGTYVTCSKRVNDGDHQLWSVERVSRTSREIKATLASWRPDILNRLFQPYGDDAQYFVLPYELRQKIWEGTKLRRQTVRKHVFDYDDFVIKSKDAVSSWTRDRLRVDDYSVLFGVIYGNARGGLQAYNWHLSSDMHDLMFFDAQAGLEYTLAAITASGFEPTFATF